MPFPKPDWLLNGASFKAKASPTTLTNGLISRVFQNGVTVALDNHMTGEAMLRAVRPEAVLTIDGASYNVGGLLGQRNLAFLRPEWLRDMKPDPKAFQFAGSETGLPRERFYWKRARHSEKRPWPPLGISLVNRFVPPAGALPGVEVEAHYELFDGAPILCKWLVIKNKGAKAVHLNRFTCETLALVEGESAVGVPDQWRLPNLHVASDYMFGGDLPENANRVVNWVPDPEFGTQVNYELKTPALLECRPPMGPDVDIPPGGSLETFRVFEMPFDATDRERQGLAVRRMYRIIAPWVTENPIMLHLTSTDEKVVKTAIEQCAELGFEMVIFSFGSGLNMEDVSEANLRRIQDFAEYAHERGVEIGGYSLLASRRIDDQNDVINPKTGKTGGAIFGNSPCLCSAWGEKYFENVKSFLAKTGFNLLEHDGSYPGDACASTAHPGHKGLGDSQWRQFERIRDFYHWCRERGLYLNVPDWYFLSGSNKSAMGYRETNWSLPRAEQLIHARQNMYDGTWEKTPTMGWMFCPLVEYQGGGPAATIEPLDAHRAEYGAHLANYFGFGVQACYRGPRLYDTPATKALVKKWVSWFKRHRAILESDVIHIRRADARDLDGVLHVNPSLPERGMAVFYNSSDQPLEKVVELPLYYTGLTDVATVQERDGNAVKKTLSRDYRVSVRVKLAPGEMTWFVIRAATKA